MRVSATYGGDYPRPWISFTSLSPIGTTTSFNTALQMINPDVEVVPGAVVGSWVLEPKLGASMTRIALATVFLIYADEQFWVVHSEDE